MNGRRVQIGNVEEYFAIDKCLTNPTRQVRPPHHRVVRGRVAVRRDCTKAGTIERLDRADGGPANLVRAVQDVLKYRHKVACRRIDDLQQLLHCSLPPQRFGKFSLALGKLAPQIGYQLLGVGQRAVVRRAHLWTSSGLTFRADYTVIGTGYQRLSVGTSAAVGK